MGRDNFKVDWDSGEIVSYDKKGNKTTMEYDAYLQNAQHLASNVFNGNVIYKLVMVQKNKKVVDIVINRYEPYKGSSNTTPSYRHTNHYDGLKFTLEINGRIRNIEAFEKGEIVSSFQETRDTTSDAMDVEELSKAPVQCDPLSFYFDPERCTNLGGQTNGWVLETTYHYTDNYTKDSDGNYIINGDRYFYKNTTYNGASSRWVQVYQENPFILSYSSSRVDSETGGHTPLPYQEVQRRIVNNLKGKAKCVFELIKASNGNLFQTTIGEFADNQDYVLQINSSSTTECQYGDEGCTDGSMVDQNGLVIIHIVFEGRGTLDLASTILHEGIHAEIFRYVNERNKGLDPKKRKDILEKYFEYEKIYSRNAQHQYMADYYVKPIAEALRTLDNNKFPLEDYLGFAWDGLRNYGYDGYKDNGKDVILDKGAYSIIQKKVLDQTEFNKGCDEK